MTTLTIEDTATHTTLTLAGRLDAYSIGALWQQARDTLTARPAARVIVDCARVDYCDGAGVALLVDLLRQPRAGSAAVEIRDLAPRYQALLGQFDPARFRDAAIEAPRRVPLIARIGRASHTLAADLRELITFIGEAAAALCTALTRPATVRWRDALAIAEEAGVNALPIVALIAFLMGVILAFQSAIAMRQFGAEIFVADLVGLSMMRELGPLMTAILLAGRSGAAFAAEIGTMKVNDEVSALTTMGLDPVRFLVVPRLIAGIAVMPLLAVFADLVGLFGGAVVMLSFDIPLVTYVNEVAGIVTFGDFAGGIVKAAVFGVLVAGIGCLRGLQTRTGAAGVGRSATSAVVSGIVLIVFVDGLFAVAFYHLGI